PAVCILGRHHSRCGYARFLEVRTEEVRYTEGECGADDTSVFDASTDDTIAFMQIKQGPGLKRPALVFDLSCRDGETQRRRDTKKV
ncbi:MAG: hypothetical protein ACLU6V_08605, partial [Lancefieldella rimae]